jgi:hypothetical protein
MASSDRQKSAQLLLYDTLTAPRHKVTITADLLEEHFPRNFQIGGEIVLFQHEGRPMGQAMTGGDGRAVRSLTPTAIGVTALSARLAASRRVTAGEATARLFVWERSHPLSLIFLHALVPHARGFGSVFPFSESNAGFPDPEPDAVKMLSTVARRNGLIYLIDADPMKLSDLRQWSARHHLPAGPIVLLQRAQGFAHELDRLQGDGWQGIKAGVPSTAVEAKILVDRGRLAVAPPTGSREKWPAKTVHAKDWADVAKRLLSA